MKGFVQLATMSIYDRGHFIVGEVTYKLRLMHGWSKKYLISSAFFFWGILGAEQ